MRIKHGANALPARFADLNRLHPLQAIHSEKEYRSASILARQLSLTGDALSAEQLRYLDTLAILMEAYERDHHVLHEPPASALSVLKLLLVEHEMTASDLGRLLGNRQLGSAVIRGDRQLSKAHIVRLATHFRVDPGLFIDLPREPQKAPANSSRNHAV